MPDTEPQLRIVIDDVRGYEEGDVGWSDATGRFEHDGTSIPVRITKRPAPLYTRPSLSRFQLLPDLLRSLAVR